MGGRRSWKRWVDLRDTAAKLAVTFKVSYPWSRNKGLHIGSNLWRGENGRRIPNISPISTSNPSPLQTPRTMATARTKMRDVKPVPPWTSNSVTMSSSRDSSEVSKRTYNIQSSPDCIRTSSTSDLATTTCGQRNSWTTSRVTA